MIKNMKKILSLILALMLAVSCCTAMVFTANAANTGESASEADLPSKYATNPNGMVGKRATITIDGSFSDWSDDMLIAQGAAWDVANHWKGGHENCVLDTYSLYAAWDNDNLYVAWQMVNTTDTWAREGDGPLSDGGRVLDVPLILALSIDPNSVCMSNKNTDGNSIWGQKMGITFETHVDRLLYMSGKAGNGEPGMFKAVDAAGNTNYTTGLTGFAAGGIEYKMAESFMPGTLIGLNSSNSPDDVFSEDSDWVDYLTFTGSKGKHNTKYDSFYEIKIPFSALGIDASYVENNGIGAMLLATRGESALDCIPFDPSMLDNVSGEYASDSSTSHEKDDVDNITVPLAQIGNMGGSVPSTTAPTTEPPTTEPPATTEPSSSQTAPVFTSEQLKELGTLAGNSDNKKAVSYAWAHYSEILSGTDEATTQVIYINLYYLYYGVLPDGVTELPYDPAVPTDPPATTEPPTTEPPATQPVGDKELSVTAKSNIADAATKVVSTAENNKVNVSYYVKSSQLLSGAQWQLTYDKSKLKLASSNYDAQGDLKVMPVADGIGDAVSNLPEEGRAKGSFQGAANSYDFTSDKALVSVDFDILGTGYTEVNLDVQYITYISGSGDVLTMVDDSVKTNLFNASVTQSVTASSSQDVPVTDKLLGDVNGDGKLNISDAANIQLFKAKLLSSSIAFDESVADYDCDGSISIKDAAQIQLVCAHLADPSGKEELANLILYYSFDFGDTPDYGYDTYTKESYDAYVAAKNSANALLAQDTATTEEYQSMIVAFMTARYSLVKI